ncbi:MAG: N-acetylmuramic acid 6-phosphate etherase [Phycisphaerae bacterium]|nr:N-acetylmuramic acid 6-phosphate etherase [Gemmatimonadaceae bacterium]
MRPAHIQHLSASPPPLDPRVTERRNPRTVNIDLASPLGIVELISAEDRTVADVVAGELTSIATAVEYAERAFRAGGRLLYAGAGTSGRLGVLDASECPPTFGVDSRMVVGIIAGGDTALRNAVEGAEDVREEGALAMDAHNVTANDFVVGIAASGTTPYVQAALQRARERGARTGLVACSPPPPAMLQHVDVAMTVVTGPEALTGSTRMKAGTATKLVLNMITTGAMIRIGKTWGNLMIDLRATNVKLKQRALRMVMEVCTVSEEQATALLAASNNRVKTAIVMHALGVDAAQAEAKINDAAGVVRRVISNSPPPVA